MIFFLILKNLNIGFFLFFFFCLTLSVYLNLTKYTLKNININIIFSYLFLGFFIYLLKIYFVHFYKIWPTSSLICFNTQIGDVLVSLSLISTLISLIFLTERFLTKVIFYLIYFYIFILCTIGMVSTSNLLIMFLYFEFIFLPSLLFVYQFGYSKKVVKTISFLMTWTFTGSLLVLFVISYLYFVYSSLNIDTLMAIKYSFFEQNFIFFLIFLGFGIKIPIWPFHYWLTKVHVEAPTGFSIFLSGFLVKTAFYCLSNFFWIFYTKILLKFWIIIILWGSIDASLRMWSSLDIKRLIAFATVQEMNLILIFFVILLNYYTPTLSIFLLMHGILSSFFFFLIDQVQKRYQTRNITSLSGLSVYAPLLSTYIWISLLIFRGFPIFLKFLIEWELLFVLLQNYQLLGFFFFSIFSFFGVLGFSKVWFTVLYGQPYSIFIKIDILKKDVITGFLLFFILFFLNFLFIIIWQVFYLGVLDRYKLIS